MWGLCATEYQVRHKPYPFNIFTPEILDFCSQTSQAEGDVNLDKKLKAKKFYTTSMYLPEEEFLEEIE